MPSQHTQWSKDQRLIQYLDQMRAANFAMWSKCYLCNQKSIGITAIKEKLYPVCQDHDNRPDQDV